MKKKLECSQQINGEKIFNFFDVFNLIKSKNGTFKLQKFSLKFYAQSRTKKPKYEIIKINKE